MYLNFAVSQVAVLSLCLHNAKNLHLKAPISCGATTWASLPRSPGWETHCFSCSLISVITLSFHLIYFQVSLVSLSKEREIEFSRQFNTAYSNLDKDWYDHNMSHNSSTAIPCLKKYLCLKKQCLWPSLSDTNYYNLRVSMFSKRWWSFPPLYPHYAAKANTAYAQMSLLHTCNGFNQNFLWNIDE